MALVHDLGEAIVGDITPHCGVTDEEKFTLERDAMKHIREMIESISQTSASDIYSLWHEYEKGETPESQFIHNLDKLEMICQAKEYESSHGIDLTSFFSSSRHHFTHPTVQALAQHIESDRSHPPH